MKDILFLLGLIPYIFSIFYVVGLGCELAKVSSDSIVTKIKNRKK